MSHPYSIRGVHEATGQVYDEYQVPVTSMVAKWPDKSRGKRQNPQLYRHPGHGSASLYNMAMRSCAWHIDDFNANHLQCAEWYHAKRLHDYLKKNELLTANIWALFHQAFPAEKEFKHAHTIHLPNSGVQGPSIEHWLRRLQFAHLTFISIRFIPITLSDLIALTNLHTLGALLVQSTACLPEIDDRDIRNWGRVVREKGAFKQLRIVGLHGFQASLQATFKSLIEFPALAICTVRPQDPYSRTLVTAPESASIVTAEIVKHALPFELLFGENCTDIQKDVAFLRNFDKLCGRLNPAQMKILYEFAGRLRPKQQPEVGPGRALISVVYGGVISKGSSPLWFKRVDVETQEQDDRLAKRPKQAERSGEEARVGVKKRKIRQGKQKDLGFLLGGFG